ncbi:MAG: L,D-transpeptidase [Candidatus Woesearchaeota archaeon]
MNRRDFLFSVALIPYLAACSSLTKTTGLEPIISPSLKEETQEENIELEKEVQKHVQEIRQIDMFSDLVPEEGLQKIIINIPSYELFLYDGGKRVLEFDCRVGKPRTPTPLGIGKILKKRDSVIFRYLSGARKGQVIRYSYLDPEKRTIKMPYDDMRGLDFQINGVMSGPVIHSTTDYWTVGTARSHGCIGMRIDDMLALYKAVKDTPLPDIETCYRSLSFDPNANNLTVWCDVYKKNTNNAGQLRSILSPYGINFEPEKDEAINQRMAEISKMLLEGNQLVQRIIDRGEDPKDELHCLYEQVELSSLITG